MYKPIFVGKYWKSYENYTPPENDDTGDSAYKSKKDKTKPDPKSRRSQKKNLQKLRKILGDAEKREKKQMWRERQYEWQRRAAGDEESSSDSRPKRPCVNPKWPTFLETPAEQEYREAREARKAKEEAKNPKPKLRKDLIYGPPADHNANHRPRSFDEIKGTILDGDGAFIYLIIDIKNEETG